MIRVHEWNRYYKMIKNHIFKYLIFVSWAHFHDQFAYFVVNLDISVCFFDDGGHIDMKFHYRGYDRPPLSWETSYRLHLCFKHQPWHVHLLESAMRTVRVTAWMMTNIQLSFSEWWGLIVYVSAVGSAASVWVGRVIITFIHNLCRTTLRC